jgi:DNA-binding transcriptional ArsR family regulator
MSKAAKETVDVVAFAKAIADETRQRIMALCCCRRLNVGEIAREIGMTQPTASHHLAVLRDAGLVTIEREGRETYYTLNQARITLCCGKLMLTFAPEQPVTQTVKRELRNP